MVLRIFLHGKRHLSIIYCHILAMWDQTFSAGFCPYFYMWTPSELQWSHRSPRQKWWSIDVITSFDVKVTSQSLKMDNCGHSIWRALQMLQYLTFLQKPSVQHGLIWPYSQLVRDNSQKLDWCHIRRLIYSMHILQVTRLVPACFLKRYFLFIISALSTVSSNNMKWRSYQPETVQQLSQ